MKQCSLVSSLNPDQPSPLLTLPIELFFNIIERISEIDIFSLRLSCQKFYVLLSDRKPIYQVDESIVHDLQNMLLREAFQRGCELERADDLRKSIAMCGLCQVSHIRQAFTAGEIALPPERRRCYCKTGVLWFCSHKYFTFDELQNLPHFKVAHHNKYQSLEPNLCLHSTHQASHHQTSPQISPFREGHEISWSFVIPRRMTRQTSATEFKNFMAQSNGRVCPHLQPEDIWYRFIQEYDKHPNRVYNRTGKIHCHVSRCCTKIVWKQTYRDVGIRFTILRCFSIERPDHPGYLAQLVVPSQGDCLEHPSKPTPC